MPLAGEQYYIKRHMRGAPDNIHTTTFPPTLGAPLVAGYKSLASSPGTLSVGAHKEVLWDRSVWELVTVWNNLLRTSSQ